MPESESPHGRSPSAAEFHPAAEHEMLAAARYYQRRRYGLGEDFLNEIERATSFAAARPAVGTSLGDGFRWVLTRRFRYAVIYRQSLRGIEVLAVAHARLR